MQRLLQQNAPLLLVVWATQSTHQSIQGILWPSYLPVTKHHTLYIQDWSTPLEKELMCATCQRQNLLFKTPYWAMQFPCADQGGMFKSITKFRLPHASSQQSLVVSPQSPLLVSIAVHCSACVPKFDDHVIASIMSAFNRYAQGLRRAEQLIRMY